MSRGKARRAPTPAVTSETPANNSGIPSQDQLLQELRVHKTELEIQNEELRNAQLALEISRDRYFDLYELAPVGYITLNPAGEIIQINLTGSKMLNVVRSQLHGHRFTRFIVPADQFLFYGMRSNLREDGAGCTCELRLLKRDHEPFYARIEATAHGGSDGSAHCRMVIIDLTETQRAVAAEIRATQMQALAVELSRAEEQERKRIAQVLHDGLQQNLVATQMHLSMLAKGEGRPVAPQLQDISKMLGESLAMSRSLTAELSPPVLYERDLQNALEWLIRYFERKHRLKVAMHVDAPTYNLEESIRTFTFHAVRELLFNTVKHSSVRQAQIVVSAPRKGFLKIEVSDKGRGACDRAPSPLTGTGGFGLFNIQQRIELFGGRFETKSSLGKGFVTTLEVPVVEGGPIPTPPPTHSGKKERRQHARKHGNIRVLLVDDHKVVRDGLALLLSTEPSIVVIGEAGDGRVAVEMARQHQPDVIVMDLSLPVMNGIEATGQIKAFLPSTRVIGLSMHDAHDMESAMLDAGAECYLSKESASELLLKAVRG